MTTDTRALVWIAGALTLLAAIDLIAGHPDGCALLAVGGGVFALAAIMYHEGDES